MAGDSTMHLATERYGSWESWQYMEKAGSVQRKQNDEKKRAWSFIDAFTSVFLPQGYPESVSEDYLSYQLWDTVQAFASSITGTLATQATLRGVGVGNKEATIAGATITWILRDGTGMLGRILFAWKKGLFADVLNDIAIFMEIVAPAFPACFTLIVCTAGIFKSLVGVAGGATRAALTVHQARRDNMADVSAKDGSQETLVNLAGLLISLLIIPLVADNIILTFVLYFFFTGLHLFSNYQAVCSVVMETLNQARLSILTYHYLKEGSILTPVEANQREPVLPRKATGRREAIERQRKSGDLVVGIPNVSDLAVVGNQVLRDWDECHTGARDREVSSLECESVEEGSCRELSCLLLGPNGISRFQKEARDPARNQAWKSGEQDTEWCPLLQETDECKADGHSEDEEATTLLQEMVEEDEEIDLYNEETFRLGYILINVVVTVLDMESGGEEDPADLFVFCGEFSKFEKDSSKDLSKVNGEPPKPPEVQQAAGQPAPQRLPVTKSQPAPASSKVQMAPRATGRMEMRGERRRELSKRMEFQDPAVLKSIKGKPTLESLDSAVVDSGISSTWDEMDLEAEDTGAMKVIDRTLEQRIPPTTLDFLSSPLTHQYPEVSAPKHAPQRHLSPRAFSPRYMQQVPACPMMPRSPLCPVRPYSSQTRFGQLHPQHRRILSQRQQRTQSSMRKQREPRSDPYANIMSAKEKAWVIRLQMIQLQSENPHLDDYYYQAYYQKLEEKLTEDELLGDRAKKEPPKLMTPYVQKAEIYEPGKELEARMFMTLLEVEELQKKMSVLPEEERIRFHDTQACKVNQLFHLLKEGFQESGQNELEAEFLPVLLVSKGKRLIARLLSFLPLEAALEILVAVLKHLPLLMAQDAECPYEALPVLYAPLCTVIGHLSFTQLVQVLKEFTAPLPDSADTRLSLACHNKFAISFLYALLSHGERLLSADTPIEPGIEEFDIWTDTVFSVAKQLSHSSLVEPLLLPSNLLSLFCRYLDKQAVVQLEGTIE
ncbi:PATL2 protein, partial [Polypterus senegalus]